MLPSSGGLRTSRLRSPKNLLLNSSSREVSGMRPSSSYDEERSTTGTFSKGPPRSNTGKQGLHEEISNGDPDGGGDPHSTSGGVEQLLSEEEPSFEGEREHLVPLLSSIVVKKRGREKNPKQRREGMQDSYQRNTKEIFISRETSHGYHNGHHFDFRAPTLVRRFENRASCVGYPDD
jgi:hypothetical protein